MLRTQYLVALFLLSLLVSCSSMPKEMQVFEPMLGRLDFTIHDPERERRSSSESFYLFGGYYCLAKAYIPAFKDAKFKSIDHYHLSVTLFDSKMLKYESYGWSYNVSYTSNEKALLRPNFQMPKNLSYDRNDDDSLTMESQYIAGDHSVDLKVNYTFFKDGKVAGILENKFGDHPGNKGKITGQYNPKPLEGFKVSGKAKSTLLEKLNGVDGNELIMNGTFLQNKNDEFYRVIGYFKQEGKESLARFTFFKDGQIVIEKSIGASNSWEPSSKEEMKKLMSYNH